MKVDREKLRRHAIFNTTAGASAEKRRAAGYLSWTAYGPDDAAALENLALSIQTDIHYVKRQVSAATD